MITSISEIQSPPPTQHARAQRRIAAPSWVIPGNLAQNCAFLAGKVDEVGLLFFEAASCLAYGDEEIPTWLDALPLRYHVHLPADLPRDGAKAADICHALMAKIDFLNPVGAVLHPPPAGPDAAQELQQFILRWQRFGRDPSLLLLENIRQNDLLSLSSVIQEYNLQVCLDMGHVLKYMQNELVANAPLMQRVGMLHVNAPGTGGEHQPLTQISPWHTAAARQMCQNLPPSATVMMELFDWKMIEESLSVIRTWL